jgi:hypothetical protein
MALVDATSQLHLSDIEASIITKQRPQTTKSLAFHNLINMK